MVPSPENDNAPKAPDKGDKTKGEQTEKNHKLHESDVTIYGSESKEASVSKLDDTELRALLDEAINYKTPKDRVGKSKLFQNLLEKAEEDDRKARATSASGSESVRYYNTTASHRTRRKRESNSVSENITHGGSLNNLAKEELYAAASHLHRPSKTVSARQHQGGSLPCNVNTGLSSSYNKQFFEEAKRKMGTKTTGAFSTIDMESESLLEHDSLSLNYNEQSKSDDLQTRLPRIQLQPLKFTSRFNLEIGGGGGGTNVDDSLTVTALERCSDKSIENDVSFKTTETIATTTHYQSPTTHYNLYMQSSALWPFAKRTLEEKKVDENGNALGQSGADGKKTKKAKPKTDKNVVAFEAKDVKGHRSDIIDDLDKLVEFIGGEDAKSKHKKLHKNNFGSGDERSKKQRVRANKTKDDKLKSNSMEEISISKMQDFNFSEECDANKIPLRVTKSNVDRPRDGRLWSNCENIPLHASAENLETADFRVVTKKKKSKKRRNSLNSRRQIYNRGEEDPEPRRKSACSVPHSDKSNDSSDADSVHSLPVSTECNNINSEHLSPTSLNLPISYADIAKNNNNLERPKWNRPPSERKFLGYPDAACTTNNSPSSEFVPNCLPKHATSVVPVQNLEEAINEIENKKDVINNNKNLPYVLSNNNPKILESNKATTGGGKACQQLNNFKNNLRNNHQCKTENIIPHNCIHNFDKCDRVPNNIRTISSDVKFIQSIEPMGRTNTKILPYNIPDVETIEKMHFKQMMEERNRNNPHPNHIPIGHHAKIPTQHQNNTEQVHCTIMDDVHSNIMSPKTVTRLNSCDNERTSSRPPVVILSGDNKEVSGLTFGFDINEQLLSGDDVCSNFVSKFVFPDNFKCPIYDQIINYIGSAWEETLNQPNVKYYSQDL